MGNTDKKLPVRAATLKKVMNLLHGLSMTESGRELYLQIAHMLSDYEEVCVEHEQTLIASISVLLDAISTHLEPSSRLSDKISLLRARLAPPLDDMELNAIRRALERCADQVTLQDQVSSDQVKRLVDPILASFGLGELHYANAIDRACDEDKKWGASSERPRQKRTEGMVKVMESLNTHEKILEGLAKSREYGKLLEMELATIRHIDELESFDEKKNALLGELENIIKDHQQLTEYFLTVSNYLETVKSEGKRLNEELSRVTTLSLTDELTGLPNRRAFIKRLRDEISRAQRYGSSLALTILDLDNFKALNDSYGHPTGDAVLRSFATDVLTAFRQNDLVARYGGEEFAVVFPNTSLEGAHQALNKALKRSNESTLQFQKETINLPSFSAGLVMFKSGDTLEALVERADDALYRAKHQGRNRIEMISRDAAVAD